MEENKEKNKIKLDNIVAFVFFYLLLYKTFVLNSA